MGIFTRKSIQVTAPVEEERSLFGASLSFPNYQAYNQNRAMLLAAVYRCVEVVSDSVAQLPCKVYALDSKGYKIENKKHPAYKLLNVQPNRKMTRYTWMKLMVSSMLLKGAGYSYIKRDERGNAKEIVWLPFEMVTVIDSPTEVKYSVVGFGNVPAEDMITVLNFTYDGVHGISTLQHARRTLSLAMDEDNSAQGFYRGGSNLSGILKVNSPLTSKQKNDIKSAWNTAFNAQDGTPNGIAVLEGNMDYQAITVNPADAELLESRKYSVIDICRFFGVSPVKVFDLTHSSYSTVEAVNLSFLSDTLTPLLSKIELELECKVFKPSEKETTDVTFDTAALLRSDLKSQAEYYNKLFQIGVLSVNDVRKEIDMTEVEDGDQHFVQVNMQTLQQFQNKSDITLNE